jgi:hypothetical protein
LIPSNQQNFLNCALLDLTTLERNNLHALSADGADVGERRQNFSGNLVQQAGPGRAEIIGKAASIMLEKKKKFARLATLEWGQKG